MSFFSNKFLVNKGIIDMRNNAKKSNILYYIIAAVLILAVVAAIFMEVPLHQEHIEQVIK